MDGKKGVYFVSDVHLGLAVGDPAEREARFVRFLKEIPRESTRAVFLLGDIWDFWYEYRDVIPRDSSRVIAALIGLMDDGVEVWFCPGNHDIWTYSYFEQIGIRKFAQPFHTEMDGVRFCLGHGDLLGGCSAGYRMMVGLFKNRVAQFLFSLLHPWLAFRICRGFSTSNRRSHKPYRFRGSDEPLYRFSVQARRESGTELFVFGHFHEPVDLPLPEGGRLVVLKDWMEGGTPHAFWDGKSLTVSF